jgi:probable addiction module antidote protein
MVGKTKTSPYDSAKYLKTEEDMAAYFAVCLEEAGDDVAFIASALDTIAHARGMTQLAKDTGLGCESLYKALSGYNRQPQLCHDFEGGQRSGAAAGCAFGPGSALTGRKFDSYLVKSGSSPRSICVDSY